MNTRTVSLFLLSATLALLVSRPLAAASPSQVPVAVPIQSVTLFSNSGIRIGRGASTSDVFYAMKYKNRVRLSPDVWVFNDFQTDPEHPAIQDCRSVVVTFAQNRVVDLRLVNQAAVSALSSTLKADSAVRLTASR